eukprot:3688846-Prorocentrum_lima.AAC.1
MPFPSVSPQRFCLWSSAWAFWPLAHSISHAKCVLFATCSLGAVRQDEESARPRVQWEQCGTGRGIRSGRGEAKNPR